MFKKIFFPILTIAVLSGCQKDPGLVGPRDAYSTSTYPQSLDDLNSILAPAYSNMRDPNLWGFTYMTKVLANLTHHATSFYGGDPGWNEMAATNLDYTNSFVNGVWQSLFTGIKNCNVALAAADYYQANGAKASESQSIDYVRGQALVLRAFYYFTGECLYGEDNVVGAGPADTLGLPIFNGVPSNLTEAQQGRSSIKATWAFIESDLTKAATLLQGKVWTGTDEGRVSEWAARGLLGKAYVFTKDYTDAKTTLLNVITNSGKTLMPYSKYHDAFEGISANEFNEESLFELNVDADAKGNDYGVYGSHAANATTINGLIWAPFSLGMDGTEDHSSALGYGNECIHDMNIKRFGFPLGYYTLATNPNYNASYNPAASGYISTQWPQKIMDPTYMQNTLAVRTNQNVDPRIYVNCLEPWVDSLLPDGKTWMRVSKPNNIPTDGLLPNRYGWCFRKYAPIYNNENANGGPSDGANIYFLRLADVYLLYAEACANTNDQTNALEYLNKVKRRAYGLDPNTPSSKDYVSLTDNTPAAVNGDPVLGTNPLYYERWAELFNEGHWWFDVCRWHLGKSEAAWFVTADNLPGNITWNDKTYSWPIPNLEMNSNAKIVSQQNKGY